MDFGPPRHICVIKFDVTIDEVGNDSVVADGTTTGNAAKAALLLCYSALGDIKVKIEALRDEPQPDITAVSLRRATVIASARAGEAFRQIEADTTTNGDIFEAAKSLAEAAREELAEWLLDSAECGT